MNVQQISITQPTGKKNNMLEERISKIELQISISVLDYEKLNMIFYESDNNKKYPIIQNNFKRVKSYLRTLRNEYYFPEFIYALEFLKRKVDEINHELITENELGNYDQYLYDFESIKNKELINDFLIKFIVRYNDYSVKKNKINFVEFQKKLNLEVLKNSLTKLKYKERITVLKKNLDVVNNEITFGKNNNVLFASYDAHFYSNRFQLTTLKDKKEVFETELSLLLEKNQFKSEQETFQTIQVKKPNKNLMFNGKDLNLSERFKIANKVLNIDHKLRTLKINDLKKYELLSFILNCNKDNARDLMNGNYPSKDRDLTPYFDVLNLNE